MYNNIVGTPHNCVIADACTETSAFREDFGRLGRIVSLGRVGTSKRKFLFQSHPSVFLSTSGLSSVERLPVYHKTNTETPQLFTLAFTPFISLDLPVNLILCMSVRCGRKPNSSSLMVDLLGARQQCYPLLHLMLGFPNENICAQFC